MNNPMFPAFGGGLPGPMGNMAQLLQQFNQFRQNFSGNAQAEVMRMVQSGQISQQQLDQVQSMARQIYNMIGGR